LIVAQFTSTGSFFVRDKLGVNYYPATFLADANGNPIVDPVIVGTPSLSPHTPQQLTLYSDDKGTTVVSNPGNYLVVPSADFMNSMYARGQAYGTLLNNNDPGAANGFLLFTFTPKFGFGDPQYQTQGSAATDTVLGLVGVSGSRSIPAFTDAGNFAAGVFGQAANAATNGAFTSADLLKIFGDANQTYSQNNMSAPFGNSPWGYESISEGFNFTVVKPSGTSFDPNDLTPAFHHCFVRGTPVLLADGNRKPIEQIEVGDIVFAFDGHGELQPRRVLRLFENTTTELIELSPAPDHRGVAETVGFTTLTVTPGHAFLTADGQFREIGKTIKQSNLQGTPTQIVLSSGTVIGVQARHIAWSLETADRYERTEMLSYASVGNSALAPRIEQGWKTYNFEVEDLHTYVAGGVRVHNDSDPAFAIDANAFQQVFGHSFTGSPGDMSLLGGAIATGQLQPTFGNVDTTGTDRFTGPFFTNSGEKIVVSADSTTWFASMVRNGEVGRIIQNNNDGSRVDSQYDSNGNLREQQDVFTNGTSAIKYIDTKNIHPYNEVDIDEDATGKPTAAQIKFDGQPNTAADFSAVGQVFGSALGRALAPNNQFAQIAVGTVAGAIGQKLAQAFSASLRTDASTVNLADAFAHFDITLAGAGAGAIASFLTAELGHALGLTGFNADLFGATIGSAASAAANHVATEMLLNHVSFETAIGSLNFATAASSAGYSVSSLLGSYLGRELVPAQTHEGAVGGQLLGAVGSAIGITAALANLLGSALNFLLPGVGSLIGTIVGTLIGDALGSVPHPAATDLLDQAGYLYGFTHYQISASDGGDYGAPDSMAASAISIINAYLKAVHGAALDHSKQVTVGYKTDPSSFYINGEPGHPANGSFLHPDDAVHSAAIDVLQHTEVIGGDLLLKRAHQNSSSNHPLAVSAGDPTLAGGDPGATGAAPAGSQPSGTEQLVVMSGDLSVAQDYENYLNNREAINALMAANPDSAFTAGWIATFARVNELGLNHVNKSDFLGGLVGYLDSVKKAGLTSDAADVVVKYYGGIGMAAEFKLDNSVQTPGALSAFASYAYESGDGNSHTEQLVFTDYMVSAGYNYLSGTLVSGKWQSTGNPGNNLWIAPTNTPSEFHTAQSGSNDILIGGDHDDVVMAGNGWDYLQGNAGNDSLYGGGGNDILRGGPGGDVLMGGPGDDAYVFARGDGGTSLVGGSHNANRRALRRNRGKSRHSSRVSLPAFLALERNKRDTRRNRVACNRWNCA
jgi:hypothetical protein